MSTNHISYFMHNNIGCFSLTGLLTTPLINYADPVASAKLLNPNWDEDGGAAPNWCSSQHAQDSANLRRIIGRYDGWLALEELNLALADDCVHKPNYWLYVGDSALDFPPVYGQEGMSLEHELKQLEWGH